MDEALKWEKRFKRERLARQEAERLLEDKSYHLYQKTCELDQLVATQKRTIEERTREFKLANDQAIMLFDAVSHTDNGVIITGPENKVIWANKAIQRISGYSPAELIGHVPGGILQGKDSLSETREYMSAKVKAREPFEADVLNYYKDTGDPYWIHLQATPVFDESNQFKYFIAIQSDITEERRIKELLALEIKRANSLAQKADDANAAKTRFLATMSHELRTPLNGIIGYSQILENNSELHPQSLNQIRIIRNSSQHLLSLINDLLDVSKIEQGVHTLAPTRFDLEGMRNRALDIIKSKADEKGLILNSQFLTGNLLAANERIHLVADSRALRQVLLNLLGNAIKFTQSGSVTLNIELLKQTGPSGRFRFEVIDTGRGIPKDKMQLLFAPFRQLDESRDILHGTGLGLYIAQQLVKLMGGEIAVESTLLEGSCFHFELELPFETTTGSDDQALSSSRNTTSAFPIAYAGHTRKILIIDDIKDNRLLLCDLLNPLGFKIDEAENGRDALQMILKNDYDLVLSDIIMPYMSGYELVEAIRSDTKIKGTLVLAISASLMQISPMEKTRMRQFDGFISKPVQVNELYEVIGEKLRLDWIYPSNKVDAPSAQAAATESNASDIEQSTDHVQKFKQDFLLLAHMGDVKALRQSMPTLKALDKRLAQTIQGQLESYKIDKIISELESAFKGGKRG